jgi:hypothetical protein
MNKKIVSLAVLTGLFCLATLVSAESVTIPNPLAQGGVNNFTDLLLKIAQGVSVVIGILGTIMLLVSGILYLTSAGNPEKINKAKAALIYALVGIAIGATAEVIVSIVLGIIGGQSR